MHFFPGSSSPNLTPQNVPSSISHDSQMALIYQNSAPPPILAPKIEDSTSNTQNLNDSSIDVSPNTSEIKLLEEFAELKKLFNDQEKELKKCEEEMIKSEKGTERMKEILKSAKGENSVSIFDSVQISSFHYNDYSDPIISPVPRDLEGSYFASSLMSLSDYQSKIKEIDEGYECMLRFTNGKYQKIKCFQNAFLRSHIPGLRI